MPLPTRACLAMALAWAGGFGLPGSPPWGLLALATVIALSLLAGPPEPPAEPRGGRRLAELLGLIGLAAILALLARALGRVIIAAPAALWAVPIVALALIVARGLGARARLTAVAAPLLVGAALGAAIVGAGFEDRGPQARGAAFSSPILGVHPRQAVAVVIDGFGPHDIVVDDYVDPPGGQGYDPTRWAARLSAELRAIAERNYADGPARAREAFARAEVTTHEALVVPAERELYGSLLGVEVRSGTTGPGSKVEFVCPGQIQGPRDGIRTGIVRACPRKYLSDGTTGLGLSPRWPGYTEVRGRARARLARVFGWPTGDARRDRRLLALESAAYLIAFVVLGLLGAIGRRDRSGQSRARFALVGVVLVGLGLAVLAIFAAPGPPPSHGGPTLLAIALILIPAGPRTRPEPFALPCALILALIAASPLAGHGDALALFERVRELLVDRGLGWSRAGALAGATAVIVLGLGLGIAAVALGTRARALGADREGRHGLAVVALTLAIAGALALRKPVDDLALLTSAGALVLLATVSLPSRAWQVGFALTGAIVAAAPILDGDARTPLALALVGLVSVVFVAVGLRPAQRPR